MKNRPLNQRLGQILITINVVDYMQVIKARKIQMVQNPSAPIGQILLNLGYIADDDLNRALSLQKDMDGQEGQV